MSTLIQSNENIKSSSVYIGYLILKELQKSDSQKVSIYKIAESLKKNGLNHSRQLTIGLSFLYSVGIIKFEEPYVWID